MSGILAAVLASCQLMPQFGSRLKDRHPVHAAACRGDTAMLENLIRVDRANAEARKADRRRPLHVAALHGGVEAIRCLVSAGADIDARNNVGATPLMFAAKGDDLDSVKLLLKGGASPKMKDAKTSSAIDWAKRNRHYGVAATIAVAAARHRVSEFP